MAQAKEIQNLKEQIGAYVAKKTQIIPAGPQTFEIATPLIDAYGDTIILWLKQNKDDCLITDEGGMLFKLDPLAEDKELYQTAQNIALGSGYQYDQKHASIYVKTASADVAQAVMKLGQLEVAISYLG